MPSAGGPRVIGLDLSLTATGLAMLRGTTVTARTIESAAPKTPRHPRTGKPLPPTLLQRYHRLYDLADAILREVTLLDPHLVVIEQPAYSKSTGSNHDRSGLWWMVVDALMHGECLVAEVTPGGRSKYATGKGNVSKQVVMLAVDRRYPDVQVANDNEADAVALAAMGARHLGHPIDDMPKVNLEAMDGVVWPASS